MKTKTLLMTIIVAVVLTSAGPSAEAAYPQTMTSTSHMANLPRPTDDPRWAKAFSHWDQREDTGEVQAALALVELIASDNPESFEAQLWQCRMNFLMGVRKRNEREAYCKKAVAAADRALKIKPGHHATKAWRFSAIVLIRDLTEEENQEVRALGRENRATRPLPIPTGDPLWAEAVKKYDARMDRESALAAIADFEKLDAKNPDRIEAKLFLAWSYYYLGISGATKDDKTAMAALGAEWGRKALKLEPRNADANYAFAATLGVYAENAGMIAIVRHSIELGTAILLVVEEDPSCMYGGFSRYLAASLATAGELSFKVAEMLGFPQELIVRVTVFSTMQEPGYLDNHYRLASMYLTLGRMDEAKAALETVINADPADLKLFEPENRVIQKKARELYDEHFK